MRMDVYVLRSINFIPKYMLMPVQMWETSFNNLSLKHFMFVACCDCLKPHNCVYTRHTATTTKIYNPIRFLEIKFNEAENISKINETVIEVICNWHISLLLDWDADWIVYTLLFIKSSHFYYVERFFISFPTFFFLFSSSLKYVLKYYFLTLRCGNRHWNQPSYFFFLSLPTLFSKWKFAEYRKKKGRENKNK